MSGTILEGTWIIRWTPVYSWVPLDFGGARWEQTGTYTYWERTK